MKNEHVGERAGRFSGLRAPQALRERLPVPPEAARKIATSRNAVEGVLEGTDSRLLVVTGPCSVHNEEAVLEYARRLGRITPLIDDVLLPVMRVYCEKPRTALGWKGFIADPTLDGTEGIARGLERARALMLGVLKEGVPVATEVLNPLVDAWLGDLPSWIAIGARTSESPVHREAASGFHAPVGFKNGTDGSVSTAVNAVLVAKRPHERLGIDVTGRAAVISTAGNPHAHVVLRGGAKGPNHDEESVAHVVASLEAAGLTGRVVVDCSHGNACGDFRRQSAAFRDLVERKAREGALSPIAGVMLESHLMEGRQTIESLRDGGRPLPGVSITDACIGWEETEALLLQAARRLRAARNDMTDGKERADERGMPLAA